MLGTDSTGIPEFGYKARVPLFNGRADRTEVDMKLGSLVVEAKLTETDFQAKLCCVVETYRDFKTMFDVSIFPSSGDRYLSYQLIGNVLAAHAAGLSFCVIGDARRQDLVEAWYAVMRCISDVELRTRCRVLTWQELGAALLHADYRAFSRRSTGFWPPWPTGARNKYSQYIKVAKKKQTVCSKRRGDHNAAKRKRVRL